MIIAVVLYIISPLNGEEICAFPWKTILYIFMLLMVEEGLKKENIALPVLRFLNSIRSTPFLFVMILTFDFLISLVLFDYVAVLIILPFTLKLLDVSNKSQYKVKLSSLIIVFSSITSILSPFSMGNIYFLLEGNEKYTNTLLSILLPFTISLFLFIVEAFLLLRKTKGDEIYLHIENEDYWDKDRRGIRVLYCAFFLTLLFGRNFNTIDLFLVVLGVFLLLDRSIYKKINYPLFLTFFFVGVSSYIFRNLGKMSTLTGLSTSILFTRLGGAIEGYKAITTLPGTLFSFSPTLIYALREMQNKKKETLSLCLLLSLPHIVIHFLFAIFFC